MVYNTAVSDEAPKQRGRVNRVVLWGVCALAAVVALLVYYFIGVDQGALSVFGSDMHVHEFVHDGRHFLGFPCH